SGRVQFSTELFETTSFVQPVALYKQQTLYTRYGNWILWCCGIVLVFIWIRSKKGSDG
ncbi:MAG: apolipoprotein N-acyltransferase, partial [Candidatus Latescibacterota bacterium]